MLTLSIVMAYVASCVVLSVDPAPGPPPYQWDVATADGVVQYQWETELPSRKVCIPRGMLLHGTVRSLGNGGGEVGPSAPFFLSLPCTGDVNGDGLIGVADWFYVAKHFGENCFESAGVCQ